MNGRPKAIASADPAASAASAVARVKPLFRIQRPCPPALEYAARALS